MELRAHLRLPVTRASRAVHTRARPPLVRLGSKWGHGPTFEFPLKGGAMEISEKYCCYVSLTYRLVLLPWQEKTFQVVLSSFSDH